MQVPTAKNSITFHSVFEELSGTLEQLLKLHQTEVATARAEIVQQQDKCADLFVPCKRPVLCEVETAQNGDLNLTPSKAMHSWPSRDDFYEVADEDALFKVNNKALRQGADASELAFDDELLGQAVEDLDTWQVNYQLTADTRIVSGDQSGMGSQTRSEPLESQTVNGVEESGKMPSAPGRISCASNSSKSLSNAKSVIIEEAEPEELEARSIQMTDQEGAEYQSEPEAVGKRSSRSSRATWLSKRSSKFHQFQMRQSWLDQEQQYENIPLIDIISQERRGELAVKKGKSQSRTQNLAIIGARKDLWFIIHPHSIVRSWWMMTCVALLTYDFIMVPFDVCFAPERVEIFHFVTMGTTIFWTVDILINFVTGVQTYDGIEKRLGAIACMYAKSWLAFDILIVLPEWLTFVFGDQFASDQVSLLRMARFGRLIRLLRLAKIMKLTRVKPLLRRLAYEFNLTKIYILVSQGWLGASLLLVVFMHILACVWYAVGNAFRDGWVQANQITTTDLTRAYVVSLRWSLCRLQGLMSDYRLETTWELLIDAALTYFSLVFAAFYLSKVLVVTMIEGTTDKASHLWKLGIQFGHRHKLSAALSVRLEKALEAAHCAGVADLAREETMLLDALPSTLQHDLIFEARRPILRHNSFFNDLCDFNRRTVRHICNGAITPLILFEDELVFAYADACNRVLFIDSGGFRYSIGRDLPAATFDDTEENPDVSTLGHGACISEPVLWTSWEHKGSLMVTEASSTMSLDASEFGVVILQHKGPGMHASRYAKHFVWNMNRCDQIDDLTNFPKLTVDQLDEDLFTGNHEDHFMFISHYKVEAGTEATLMRDLLLPLMHEDLSHPANNLRSPIFIDSEDLSDLSRLKEHVIGSTSLVLLLTPGVLSRPWCLIEIVTALENGVSIVPVEVQRPGSSYRYPDDDYYAGIHTGKLVTQDGVELLAREGVSLPDVEKAIRQVFLKISCPFSPHKTKAIREAELRDILKRCNGDLDEVTKEIDLDE